MQRQASVSDSKRSILQNTGLLNETVLSPVNVDASVTKTSRKRFALNNFFSRSSLDLGHFNQSKLSPFYQSHYEQTQHGEVLCLASFDDHNQLTINSQALKILKQYQKNTITFVGNVGKKDSGKSFWYDKILNLSQVQGAQYSKMQDTPGLYFWSIPFVKNNLRIFLLDFASQKNGQSLLGEDEKLLDLEMILSEALVLVPNPQDKKLKISESVYSNLISCMSRLSDKGSKTSKQSSYWPRFFYSLYRSIKTVSPQNDKLSYLFADYNYSIVHNALSGKVQQKVSQLALMESSMVKGQSSSRLLNESYVKRTSLVFKDIYKKLNGKSYEGLPFTGDILPYILSHSVKNLNSSKNIKIDKMFNQIKKDIYENKLEAGKFIYDLNYDPLQQPSSEQNHYQTPQKNKITDSMKSNKVNGNVSQKDQSKKVNNNLNKQIIKVSEGQSPSSQSYLKQLLQETTIHALPLVQKPKPRPLDEVLEIFRKTNENVLKDYHEKKYDPILHEEYEQKLLTYGEAKQTQVLNYNKNQTYNILSSTLPKFTEQKELTELDPQLVLKHLDQLKNSGKPLDHNRAKPVAQKLKDIAFYAKQHKFFNVWMTEVHYKERKFEMKVQDKKKQLQNLKYNLKEVVVLNTVQDNEAQELKDEHNRSTDKIEKVKSQLDLSKKLNKNGISDEEYMKELQNHKKKLQDALKENDRKLREISVTPTKDPRISLLRQKLDDKKTIELQVEAGLSNIIHSRLNNSSSSVLSVRKSQVRKIGDGGIKKSYINKSMTK